MGREPGVRVVERRANDVDPEDKRGENVEDSPDWDNKW